MTSAYGWRGWRFIPPPSIKKPYGQITRLRVAAQMGRGDSDTVRLMEYIDELEAYIGDETLCPDGVCELLQDHADMSWKEANEVVATIKTSNGNVWKDNQCVIENPETEEDE